MDLEIVIVLLLLLICAGIFFLYLEQTHTDFFGARNINSYEDSTDLSCCPSNCPLVYDPVCGTNGITYVSVCGASLANVQVAYHGVCDGDQCDPDDFCVEPDPILRFICTNGEIVSNRADCGDGCPTTVATYYYCPDNSMVTDPSACSMSTQYSSMNIRTVYECSDGTFVAEAADCSANCVIEVYDPYADNPRYYGNLTSQNTVVDTIYECWDGTVVQNPSDCPLYCERGCPCSDEYNPVCVNGQTYRNPCYAGCEGSTTYTDGECREPCASSGRPCTPIISTLTYVPNDQAPTCCEDGTYCSSNGVCTPYEVDCSDAGEVCIYDSDCCDGSFCNANHVCQVDVQCQSQGQSCGYSGTSASVYLGTCCAGYQCINNICAVPCSPEFGNCLYDTDCCGDLVCSTYGQCREPCLGLGENCTASIYCCGATYCVEGTCKNQKCSEENHFCRRPGDTAYGAEYDCCEGYECINNLCIADLECALEGSFCRNPGDTAYGPEYDCCDDMECVRNICTEPTELCSGPTEPEWSEETSCATGSYNGVWGTYCGYCEDNMIHRYYCIEGTTTVMHLTNYCAYYCTPGGTTCTSYLS